MATRKSDTYATLSLRIDKQVIARIKAAADRRQETTETLVEDILRKFADAYWGSTWQ